MPITYPTPPPNEHLAGFYKVEFQDQGQDLLWFEVKDGVVSSAGPFHHGLYAGVYVVEMSNPGFLVYQREGRRYSIKYPVVAITQIQGGA